MRMNNGTTSPTVSRSSSGWQLRHTTLHMVTIRLTAAIMDHTTDRVCSSPTDRATTGEGMVTGVADTGAGKLRSGLLSVVHQHAMLWDRESSFTETFPD